MAQMVTWAKSTSKYFEPVKFSAVELLKNIPPSWMTDDLKEVPVFLHSGKDNIVEADLL